LDLTGQQLFWLHAHQTVRTLSNACKCQKTVVCIWFYSATVFWLHAHNAVPLSSSDISKGQKIAVCDWTPTQQLLDKSCFKGEISN
jgi:hypothetical protein